jgi:hypothetical protein
MPSATVYESTGSHCVAFEPKKGKNEESKEKKKKENGYRV